MVGILSDFSTTDASNTAFAGNSVNINVMKPSDARKFAQAIGGAQARWLADAGAVNTVGGTGDAITVTLSQPYTAYGTSTGQIPTGALIRFQAGAANTMAATLNVNSIGTKAIRKTSGGVDVALVAGDIVAGETYTLIYRSSANSAAGAWVMIGVYPMAAASTSTSGLVKLATNTQAEVGTDTAAALTSSNLAALLYAGTDNSGGATITMGDGGYFNLITSTTPITAFAFTNDAIGRTARIRFNTVRTLTYNATSLIIPGAANITTAVGDIMQIRSLGSGNFVVDWYTLASGSGGETLLATITPTATATLTATGLATGFNCLRMEFQSIQPATGSALGLQMNISSDNGSTFDTAANIGAASAGTNVQGMAWLSAAGTTATKFVSAMIGSVGTNGATGIAVFSTKTSPTNAVRFTWSGGQNFAAQGTIKIYGVK